MNKDDQYFLAQICVFTGNTAQQILEKNNHEGVSEIRHILTYFLIVDFGWTIARTAKALNRHHASVHNSIRRYKNLVDSSQKFRDMAAEYRDLIHEGLLSIAAIS